MNKKIAAIVAAVVALLGVASQFAGPCVTKKEAAPAPADAGTEGEGESSVSDGE